jgi:hypothetical protein
MEQRLKGVEFRAEDATYDGSLHWAIRLRRKLMTEGTHRWNGWVRGITAWLERRANRRHPWL